MSETFQRLARRLSVGIAWQWRWAVLARELRAYSSTLGEIALNFGGAVLSLIFIPMYPLVILWRFTGGMAWLALTAPDDVIDRLGALSDKRAKRQ